MATQSSVLACKMPWTEEPGGLQSMGSQRVEYNLATKQRSKIGLSAFTARGWLSSDILPPRAGHCNVPSLQPSCVGL